MQSFLRVVTNISIRIFPSFGLHILLTGPFDEMYHSAICRAIVLLAMSRSFLNLIHIFLGCGKSNNSLDPLKITKCGLTKFYFGPESL